VQPIKPKAKEPFMSVLQPIRKRKCKTKLLTHEEVRVVNREDYEGFEIDTKVELIRSLIPIALMHVYEVLDAASVSR